MQTFVPEFCATIPPSFVGDGAVPERLGIIPGIAPPARRPCSFTTGSVHSFAEYQYSIIIPKIIRIQTFNNININGPSEQSLHI